MIQPKNLQKGDTVGLIAMAWEVDMELLKPSIQTLESWGLNVVFGESLISKYHQFAGPDEVRAGDFQKMLDDKSISAIFSVRGGYGSTRILDRLDFKKFKANPKWVIGFSDITAVHCHLHNFAVESIHGPMPKIFMQEGGEEALESLRKLLFGEPFIYQVASNPMNRTGEVSGLIVGGNLAMLSHVIGSNSDISTDGKLLFLEDVGEYLYAVDRMMIQLKRSGKLRGLKGLIVGQFTELKDNETPFGKTANEIIEDTISEYDFPVCYDFPVGHVPNNLAIPFGRKVNLSITEQEVKLTDMSSEPVTFFTKFRF